jgi:hypothetical protein
LLATVTRDDEAQGQCGAVGELVREIDPNTPRFAGQPVTVREDRIAEVDGGSKNARGGKLRGKRVG